MQLNIPPIIPYVVGALLVIFGALRVRYLGVPRSPRISEEDLQSSTEAPPVRGKEQRRHRRMGVLWVLMGLFLLISTYLQIRRR
jgi:predicted nucleic acid-binding Zn ribbon protein